MVQKELALFFLIGGAYAPRIRRWKDGDGYTEDEMDDMALELRNQESISRSECRYLEAPAEAELCGVCGGTGVLPGTETENLFGDPCTEGCKIDIQRIRDQGQK